MTRKNSGCNTSRLVRIELKRQLPLIFLSIISLLAVMPIQLLFTVQKINQGIIKLNKAAYANIAMLAYSDTLTAIVLAVLSIITATVLFHYLHNARQTNFYHAQPMKRTSLFFSKFISGIILIIVPYLISAALMFIVCGANGFSQILSAKLIAQKIFIDIAFILIVYAISVLACVLSGSTPAALLINIGFQFGFWLLAVALSCIVNWFYPSMLLKKAGSIHANRDILSPIIFRGSTSAMIAQSDGSLCYAKNFIIYSVIYIIAAFLIIMLSLWLYNIRKSERSGQDMAFPVLRVPIKYVAMTICAVVAAEIIFSSSQLKYTYYLGFAVGIFVSHFIIEIIFGQNIRAMFSHQVSLWIYVGVFALCTGLMGFDITGYNTRLPERSEIIGANVISPYNFLSCAQPEADGNRWSPVTEYKDVTGSMLKEKSNIDEIYAMAKRGSYCMKEYRQGISYNSDQYDIAFQLSDGSYFVRSYYCLPNYSFSSASSEQMRNNELNTLKKRAAKVRFSQEYLSTRSDTALIDASKTQSLLVLNSSQIYYGGTEITDKDTISAVLESIKKESLRLTPEYVSKHLPLAVLNVRAKANVKTDNNEHILTDDLYNVQYDEYYGGDTQLRNLPGDYSIPIYGCEGDTIELLKQQGASLSRYDYGSIKSITIEHYSDSEQPKPENPIDQSWTAEIKDKKSFKSVLSGSVAYDILNCCDPYIRDMYDRRYDILVETVSADGKVSDISAAYIKGMVPDGLEKYAKPVK